MSYLNKLAELITAKLTKTAAQKLGSGFLNSLNSSDIIKQHFANGGFVSPSVIQAAAMGSRAKEQAPSKSKETITLNLMTSAGEIQTTADNTPVLQKVIAELQQQKRAGKR